MKNGYDSDEEFNPFIPLNKELPTRPDSDEDDPWATPLEDDPFAPFDKKPSTGPHIDEDDPWAKPLEDDPFAPLDKKPPAGPDGVNDETPLDSEVDLFAPLDKIPPSPKLSKGIQPVILYDAIWVEKQEDEQYHWFGMLEEILKEEETQKDDPKIKKTIILKHVCTFDKEPKQENGMIYYYTVHSDEIKWNEVKGGYYEMQLHQGLIGDGGIKELDYLTCKRFPNYVIYFRKKAPTITEAIQSLDIPEGAPITSRILTFQDILTANSISTMTELVAMIKRKLATHRLHVDDILDQVIMSAEDSFQCNPILSDNYFQPYTCLKSFDLQNIAGMGDTFDNPILVFKSYAYLMYTLGVKRIVALHYISNVKEAIWYILKSMHPAFCDDPEIEYVKEKIIDFNCFTLESAMRLLNIYQNKHIKHVIHCTSGHGRTGTVMFLLLIYHLVITEKIAINDREVFKRMLLLKPNLGEFYCMHAAYEFFISSCKFSVKLIAKRINTIIASIILVLGRSKSASEDDCIEEAFLLDLTKLDKHDLNSNENEMQISARLADVEKIVRVRLQYPPVKKIESSEKYFGKGGKKPFTKKTEQILTLSQWKEKVFGKNRSEWSSDVYNLETIASVKRILEIATNGKFFETETNANYIIEIFETSIKGGKKCRRYFAKSRKTKKKQKRLRNSRKKK